MSIILKKLKGKSIRRNITSSDWRHLTKLLKILLVLFLIFSSFHYIIKKKVQHIPAQTFSATKTVNSQYQVKKIYTVKAKDTLWSIVIKQYPNEDPAKKVKEIEQLNHLQGNSIKPGQPIKLP